VILEKEIILSHNKSVRFFATMYLLSILAGDIYLVKQLLSQYKALRLMDGLGIICALILTSMFLLLFFDSWKKIKVNNNKIIGVIFFSWLWFVNWNDVIGVEETKTKQYKNFVQGKIIILKTKQGKNIEIAEKYTNFDLFYKNFIESRWPRSVNK
jgi:hypothetical protein